MRKIFNLLSAFLPFSVISCNTITSNSHSSNVNSNKNNLMINFINHSGYSFQKQNYTYYNLNYTPDSFYSAYFSNLYNLKHTLNLNALNSKEIIIANDLKDKKYQFLKNRYVKLFNSTGYVYNIIDNKIIILTNYHSISNYLYNNDLQSFPKSLSLYNNDKWLNLDKYIFNINFLQGEKTDTYDYAYVEFSLKDIDFDISILKGYNDPLIISDKISTYNYSYDIYNNTLNINTILYESNKPKQLYTFGNFVKGNSGTALIAFQNNQIVLNGLLFGVISQSEIGKKRDKVDEYSKDKYNNSIGLYLVSLIKNLQTT